MFVDSHCHLNYLDDPEEKIVSAGESGVGAILCIGVEQDRISEVVDLATRFPRVWCSVGEHPDSAEGCPDWVRGFIDHPKVSPLARLVWITFGKRGDQIAPRKSPTLILSYR